MKVQSIKLAHGVVLDADKGIHGYKVITVKNSTAYHPGEILAKAEVDSLCNNQRWEVVIVALSENPRG